MAKTNPIRVGLAGIGRAGWGMHCEELKGKEHLFQIVAACARSPERREKMAQRYPGCKTYATLDALLADPNVEMVNIATRSCDHYAHAVKALKAGKIVFQEKPISLTHAEAKKLAALGGGKRPRLFVRHNRRFEPGFQHAREMIDSGILGDVFEIKLRRCGYQRRDDWQTIKKFGGGQLLNWGPHIIDHGLRLLDSPLKSMWSDLKLVAAVGDAEDHLKIILTGKNGRLVDIEISGGAATGEPEYRIWGTRGSLISEGDTFKLKYLDPKAKLSNRKPNPNTPAEGVFSSPDNLVWIEETVKIAPKKPVTLADTIWEELYKAVRKGARFPISLDEAAEVMKVVTAAKKGTRFE